MSRRVGLAVTRTVWISERELDVLVAVEGRAGLKGLCLISEKALMEALGCGRSTVKHAVRSCIERDWLTVASVYRDDGGRAESAYALTESGRAICAAAAERARGKDANLVEA